METTKYTTITNTTLPNIQDNQFSSCAVVVFVVGVVVVRHVEMQFGVVMKVEKDEEKE